MDMFYTLQQAKDDYITEVDDAVATASNHRIICPCCYHDTQVYQRSVAEVTVYELMRFYRKNNLDYAHKKSVKTSGSGEFAKMASWGLIEELPRDFYKKQKKRGRTAGFWRVTELGLLFLMGKHQIVENIHFFKNDIVGTSGELRYIRGCLKEQFDYDEFIKREGW